MVCGGMTTASAASRSWNFAHDAGLTGMKNARRSYRSGRFPLIFPKNALEVRQEAAEKAIYEAVGMKMKGKWKFQKSGILGR